MFDEDTMDTLEDSKSIENCTHYKGELTNISFGWRMCDVLHRLLHGIKVKHNDATINTNMLKQLFLFLFLFFWWLLLL